MNIIFLTLATFFLSNSTYNDTIYRPDNNAYQIILKGGWNLISKDEVTSYFQKSQNPKGLIEIDCRQICCGKINYEVQCDNDCRYLVNCKITKIKKYRTVHGDKIGDYPGKQWILYYGHIWIRCNYTSHNYTFDTEELKSVEEMIKSIKINKKYIKK
jgi:hypothetical protein